MPGLILFYTVDASPPDIYDVAYEKSRAKTPQLLLRLRKPIKEIVKSNYGVQIFRLGRRKSMCVKNELI